MELLMLVLVPLAAYAIIRFRRTGMLLPTYFLGQKQQDFLEKNFEFYQRLPPLSKKIFLRRVAVFISSKKFTPRQMDQVTWEMKVLIAASAIQLTFGFPKVHLSFFRHILVYPDSFFSHLGQRHHRGEVNPKVKAIVLSWKHFLEGYLQPDGRNLGLHEMAHALRLENRIMNHEYDFLSDDVLHEWEKKASRTMKEIQCGNETFFRPYGATNNEEFFAVAIENFFERPRRFKDVHPRTYDTLCRLLKQDPLLLEPI